MDQNFGDQRRGDSALQHNKAVMDETGAEWAKVEQELIAHYKHIITLRGAGTNNGIDKEAAARLVEEKLVPRIREYMKDGPVAIMFDGDGDDREKPDIGSIMGGLRDALDQEAEVAFIAAQKQSWYDYAPQAKDGGNLANASGKEYQTTVFPDGKFAGDHNSFTQSEAIANAPGSEQWYVGASGPIASEQLGDFNGKIKEGTRKVVMFKAPINAELSGSMAQKLADAETAQDAAKITKFKGIIEQRQNTYGVHFDNAGNFTVDPKQYEKLEFEVV